MNFPLLEIAAGFGGHRVPIVISRVGDTNKVRVERGSRRRNVDAHCSAFHAGGWCTCWRAVVERLAHVWDAGQADQSTEERVPFPPDVCGARVQLREGRDGKAVIVELLTAEGATGEGMHVIVNGVGSVGCRTRVRVFVGRGAHTTEYASDETLADGIMIPGTSASTARRLVNLVRALSGEVR